jgi:hypothetical protein
MMKRQLRTAVAMALGLASGAALSAGLENLNGQTCGDAIGSWHFSASAISKNTHHFNCTASGALLNAATNLPGRLVLSDYTCTEIKEPPCDPKKEICDPK